MISFYCRNHRILYSNCSIDWMEVLIILHKVPKWNFVQGCLFSCFWSEDQTPSACDHHIISVGPVNGQSFYFVEMTILFFSQFHLLDIFNHITAKRRKRKLNTSMWKKTNVGCCCLTFVELNVKGTRRYTKRCHYLYKCSKSESCLCVAKKTQSSLIRRRDIPNAQIYLSY